MPTQAETVAGPARLRRTLRLRDLILYGVIAIQPVAPMSVFGVLSQRGRGHVVTAILIAMVAMLFTSISYGRMARAYPSAGSAFTYVSREIHPVWGYITGWSMVMDYVLNPLICVVWCSQQAHDFAPDVPVVAWKVFFAVTFTLLNLRGVRASARVNTGMAAAMGAVIVVFFAAAAHRIFGAPHAAPGFFSRPFYDPRTFTFSGLFGCTSIAVLTYIGFDGISTLSEEAENPRKNILLATVSTCAVIGLLSAAEVYAAQLLWPASRPFPNIDTAFVWVAASAWKPLFGVLGLTLLVANFGSGFAAQLGAARLLYGMGRSGALPACFGAVDPTHGIPRNNVLIVGAVVLVGAFVLSYDLGAEMLNFGALIAFMGVNAAAFLRYFARAPRRRMWNFIPPVLGFLICFGLWLNLSRPAILAGSAWMAAGLLLGFAITRGFRRPFSFDEGAEPSSPAA
ncbi:MAG: APC family permease [Opitutaceae bacterium]